MEIARRGFLASVGAALMAPAAFADGRTPLEGGGSVVIPGPYVVQTDYPNYSATAQPATVAYRKWRSTMSGHPECDGMVAVARVDQFKTLEEFCVIAKGGLSIQWGDASRIPGQRWDGNEQRYPRVPGQGPNGPELIQQLAVHRVGFFDVYDKAAHMYAVAHKRGLHVAVWIFDDAGGIKAAAKISDRIAASYQP